MAESFIGVALLSQSFGNGHPGVDIFKSPATTKPPVARNGGWSAPDAASMSKADAATRKRMLRIARSFFIMGFLVFMVWV